MHATRKRQVAQVPQKLGCRQDFLNITHNPDVRMKTFQILLERAKLLSDENTIKQSKKQRKPEKNLNVQHS